LKILNPVSADLDIMRNDLAISALTSIAHNLAHRNIDLKLFEIGKAYCPPDSSGNWVEEERLLLVVTGDTPGNWRDKPRPADFYDLTGGLDRLSAHFHWPKLIFAPCDQPYLDPDQSFALKLGDAVVGSIGLVKGDIARRFEVKQSVYVLQLITKPLYELSHRLAEFAPLPVFPAATRDLAMVVNESTRAEELVEAIRSEAGGMAESVNVFDLYVGKQIGEGRKSIAVAIILRDSDRSLSNVEVDQLQERIVARLKQSFDAEIRNG
jgi:phenylalanyl-tRNA synthetase beta chain